MHEAFSDWFMTHKREVTVGWHGQNNQDFRLFPNRFSFASWM